MSARHDSTSTRDTRDIESALADTRTRIDHKLERLEDQFQPGAIVDHVWRYARAKTEDGTPSRLQQTLTRNPLPVALMGVGLAWLVLSGRNGSVPRPDSPLAEGTSGQARPGQPGSARPDAAASEAESVRRTSTIRTARQSSESTAAGSPAQHADQQSRGAAATTGAATVTPPESAPGQAKNTRSDQNGSQ